jgi:hypothetical protein
MTELLDVPKLAYREARVDGSTKLNGTSVSGHASTDLSLKELITAAAQFILRAVTAQCHQRFSLRQSLTSTDYATKAAWYRGIANFPK